MIQKMQVLHNTTTIMENNLRLVDIHTHLLFDIDDGAENIDESMQMIEMWIKQGVNAVVATPHFDLKRDNRELFLQQREKAVSALRLEISKRGLDFTIKTSAELYFRRELIYEDLTPFLVEGTDYLIIELPTRTVPSQIKSTFEELIIQGYSPILVHIERYSILKQDLELFYDLVEMGVVCQVNAETFISSTDSFVKAAVKKNFVHLTGSDAHGMSRRKPNLNEGLEMCGEKEKFNYNAQCIFNNIAIDTSPTSRIKKVFNRYF